MVVTNSSPYHQVKRQDGSILREFRHDVSSDELVWHQDKLTREVKVIKANGWKLQLEVGLPFGLRDGDTYLIPARSWHRVIKGSGNLTIEITEFDGEDIITGRAKRQNA